MRLRPLLILATCLASLTAQAQLAAAKPKVAVLGLEVSGDSATDQKATEAAKVLTRELRREANRSDGPFDLAPNSGKDLLEMKLLSDCSDEGRRCMSEIGKQLRAQRLIYGKLERTRRGYAVELRLLDTESAQLLKELDETVTQGEVAATGGLQRRARALYAKLTGAGEEGSLSITSNAERGTVYVDGGIRTSLSAGSARVSGLTEGVHSIAIEAPGFDRYETEVDIAAGANRSMRARLKEAVATGGEEPSGGEVEAAAVRPGGTWRIAAWGGVIATVGAGAGWAYSGLTVRGEEKDIKAASSTYSEFTPGPGLEPSKITTEKTDKNGNPTVDDACTSYAPGETSGPPNDPRPGAVREILSSCDKAKRHRTLVNLVWIPATAAAALFTGFAIYKGYIAPGKMTRTEREAAARKHRKPSRLTVAPAIGPNLLGAGLELQF
jgi:hypothetical protein